MTPWPFVNWERAANNGKEALCAVLAVADSMCNRPQLSRSYGMIRPNEPGQATTLDQRLAAMIYACIVRASERIGGETGHHVGNRDTFSADQMLIKYNQVSMNLQLRLTSQELP